MGINIASDEVDDVAEMLTRKRRPRGRQRVIDELTLSEARILRSSGLSIAIVAKELGVDDSTLSRALGPSGHRGRERALTPEQVELAREFRFEKKWSNQRIADELGCGEATVRRALKQ